MIGTGKQYGLEVTSLVDERRDPVKASFAAARYLKDLYDIFGDWTLVIASYNCGPNNVSKAIKRAGGVTDYWTIYPYLPRETQGYVPAFIAANYIMNYYCEHNICPVKTTLPPTSDTLHVSRNVRLDRVGQVCGVPLDELKALNPQYRTNMVPGEVRPCILRLPGDKVNAFIEAGDSIYVQPEEQKNVVEVAVRDTKSRDSRQSRGVYVKVRRGDTLGAIARRNHTTVDRIKRLNKMRSTRINPGHPRHHSVIALQRYIFYSVSPNLFANFFCFVPLLCCRGDPTRTGDHLVPNQVRYQLRYTPCLTGLLPRKAMQK